MSVNSDPHTPDPASPITPVCDPAESLSPKRQLDEVGGHSQSHVGPGPRGGSGGARRTAQPTGPIGCSDDPSGGITAGGLTVKAAAARVGVSEGLIRKKIADGVIPHFRLGPKGKRGKIVIAPADLDGLPDLVQGHGAGFSVGPATETGQSASPPDPFFLRGDPLQGAPGVGVMKLLKVPEVAERLNCSESFVYEAIVSGELKHYRLGKGQGGIRLSEEQISNFLAGREKGGQPQPAAPAARKRVRLRHLDV
ncbi:MAG: hypothetical protein JWO38_272 [Gemmataceae bacterium]|nr:hypothetical protein [Gemmataceae bacterium]